MDCIRRSALLLNPHSHPLMQLLLLFIRLIQNGTGTRSDSHPSLGRLQRSWQPSQALFRDAESSMASLWSTSIQTHCPHPGSHPCTVACLASDPGSRQLSSPVSCAATNDGAEGQATGAASKTPRVASQKIFALAELNECEVPTISPHATWIARQREHEATGPPTPQASAVLKPTHYSSLAAKDARMQNWWARRRCLHRVILSCKRPTLPWPCWR